jgi:hypothetical protein
MSKKTSPLSDDLVIARATYLKMIDTLEGGVDAIQACENAAQRAQAIGCLREQISLIRQGYQLSSSLSYLATHEKGRTAAARKGGAAKAAFAHAIIPCLERDWDSIPPDDRQTHEGWLKHNLKRILTDCGYPHFIDDDIVFARVLRWLSPSQRPKP